MLALWVRQRRDAFTYGGFDPAETTELGCLFVQPTRIEGYDAAVYYWTAAAAVERGLADEIETACREWVATEWPFARVAYPGRDVTCRHPGGRDRSRGRDLCSYRPQYRECLPHAVLSIRHGGAVGSIHTVGCPPCKALAITGCIVSQ